MPAVTHAQAIKALNTEGRVGGYLVLWGGPDRKDLQGEYFTPETDLALSWFDRRPALYQHGLDGTLETTQIGVIESLKADATGLWAEAQLDMRNRYVRRILELIKKGILSWSSGTLAHMAQAEADGKITRWPLVEGSATPTPAEFRGTDIVPVKHYAQMGAVQAAYKSLGFEAIPDLLVPDAASEGATAGGQSGEGDPDNLRAHKTEGDMPDKTTVPNNAEGMTRAEIMQMFRDLRADEKAEAERKALEAKAARADELEKRVAELEASREGDEDREPAQPRKRLPGKTEDEPGGEDAPSPVRIQVLSKFDHASAEDMLHGYMMLSNMKSKTVSNEYMAALRTKMVEAKIHDKLGIKADELMQSDLASYGDEWVPELWSAQLWEKARVDNVVAQQFGVIPMPSNPYKVPAEGSDPTVYYVPETEDEEQLTLDSSKSPIPDSQIGSGNVTLTAQKLALRTGWSAELTEDSIVPILARYRQQAIRAMADALDSVIMNGDTTLANNINNDGATIVPASQGYYQNYLSMDGLRHLPLITTTAQATDATGNSPTIELLRTARFTLPARYSLNVSNLVWFVDPSTYAKLLNINEFREQTAQSGQLRMADGVPVLPTDKLSLADSDGKITNGGNTSDTGTAVLAYKPGWVVGYRRRVVSAVEYLPYYDAYQMVLTVRAALARQDAYVAAIVYNIGV